MLDWEISWLKSKIVSWKGDTLYNIFEKIFANENELEEFLKKYNKWIIYNFIDKG